MNNAHNPTNVSTTLDKSNPEFSEWTRIDVDSSRKLWVKIVDAKTQKHG